MAQPCPIGQVAPPDAVSAAECGCLPGFGPAGERLCMLMQWACRVCDRQLWLVESSPQMPVYTQVSVTVAQQLCISCTAKAV